MSQRGLVRRRLGASQVFIKMRTYVPMGWGHMSWSVVRLVAVRVGDRRLWNGPIGLVVSALLNSSTW